MASKTDIANEALAKIGEPRIADIASTTDPNAVFLSGIWETTVKQVASEIPWKCFTTKASLTAATAPSFGWTKAYTLPTDYLRALWFNGHSSPDNDFFAVEQSELMTDETIAQLVYTAYSDTSTAYSAAFIEALSLYLASKLALFRRQDTELAAKLTEQYQQLIQNREQNVSVCETKSLWLEVARGNDIITAALARIAEPKAVAFNDPAFISTTTVTALYTSCLKQVMRAHDWKSLCARESLTVSETTPDFGWDYEYPLPDDCMRIVEFNGRTSLCGETFFRQEGSSILTNADKAELLYVAYTTDDTLYDETFKEAVTTLLASKLVTQRRRDANMAALLMQQYEAILSKARVIDSTQQHRARVDPRFSSYSNMARRLP